MRLTIRIGTPLQRPAYLERPELLQAVVAHEFGHAVMIARSDEFPAPAIFGMYGIGLFILLVVFPTKRGVLLGGIAITAVLAIMTMIPRWEFINNAYLTFMLNLPVAAGTLWWAKIRARPPTWIAIHLPSIRNLTLASLLAAPTFLGASDFPVDGEHGNSRPDRSPFGFSGVRRRSFELACRVLIPQTSTALMRCRIALACNIRRY